MAAGGSGRRGEAAGGGGVWYVQQACDSEPCRKGGVRRAAWRRAVCGVRRGGWRCAAWRRGGHMAGRFYDMRMYPAWRSHGWQVLVDELDDVVHVAGLSVGVGVGWGWARV